MVRTLLTMTWTCLVFIIGFLTGALGITVVYGSMEKDGNKASATFRKVFGD